MAWFCETCGREFDSARMDSTTGEWRCPGCGAEVRLASTEVPPPGADDVERSPDQISDSSRLEPEAAPASMAGGTARGDRTHDSKGASLDTVFQPILMMESIMDELEAPVDASKTATARAPGTETLETDPESLPSPFLQLDVQAFLLILGATPGHERRPLVRAKTTIGRRSADVELDDPAMSSLHFQIEAFGKEFFVRDLESRNGTFLNGKKIRYSQLLPGDQLTAGKTSLIFRTSDDLIDRD